LPYFILEIITRYQQFNPGRQGTDYLSGGDVFPYWTFFKVIRSCDDYITEDEFRRFLVKISSQDQVDSVIETIRKYREDLKKEVSRVVLEERYGKPIEGTPARPLYFMHRAGEGLRNISNFHYGIIIKDPDKSCPLGTDIYRLNSMYGEFIDYLIANKPQNLPLDIDAKQWFAHYGAPVKVVDEDNLIDDDDIVWQQVKDLLNNGIKGIIFSGPPGTSKTWYANKVAAKIVEGDLNCIESIQFHPSYSYEDFVEGYVPNKDSEGKSGFIVKKKVFLQMCYKAMANPHKTFVLIIDEFNRGDPSKIFGELLTYLEYRGTFFRLPYSEEEICIPQNLIIIGTMNPYDKSVSDLDVALERRFEIFPMEPDVDLLKVILQKNGMSEELKGKVIRFFVDVQSIFEIGLGHAFFNNISDEKGLKRLWKFKLQPLFKKEYKYEPETFNKIKELYPWSD
jgi:hypothetical protein